MRQRKVWLEAEYWATKDSVDVAQAAFSQSGAIGMAVDDGVMPEGQRKYADHRVLLKAYFEADTHSDHVNNTLGQFFSRSGLPKGDISFSFLEEDDWQANFIRSCTTFEVLPRIFIVPSFEIEQFKKNPLADLFIEIDPENAFGTGQHQTTKLCLTAIHHVLTKSHENRRRDFSCLDVGTGSGILSILMKKLLVASVLATETDADALATARKNCVKNGVDVTTLVVDESHRYEFQADDLIVANILASVLIDMAKDLALSVKPGGIIFVKRYPA